MTLLFELNLTNRKLTLQKVQVEQPLKPEVFSLADRAETLRFSIPTQWVNRGRVREDSMLVQPFKEHSRCNSMVHRLTFPPLCRVLLFTRFLGCFRVLKVLCKALVLELFKPNLSISVILDSLEFRLKCPLIKPTLPEVLALWVALLLLGLLSFEQGKRQP